VNGSEEFGCSSRGNLGEGVHVVAQMTAVAVEQTNYADFHLSNRDDDPKKVFMKADQNGGGAGPAKNIVLNEGTQSAPGSSNALNFQMDSLNENLPVVAANNRTHVEASQVAPSARPASRERVPWRLGSCYPVIPARLFFSAHVDDDHTMAEIQSKPNVFFFSTDLQERYQPFCADFGPVNLGIIFRFCDMMHQKMSDPRLARRPLVYYCSDEPDLVTNTCFLLSAYLVVDHSYSPEAAAEPFSNFDPSPIIPFRDATYVTSTYDLRLSDCLAGLHKAIELGWLDCDTFDVDEYEKWDDPLHGDFHQLCPKFIGFKGPVDDGSDEFAFRPDYYAPIFTAKGVKAVIRLNEPTTYDPAPFKEHGIAHHDLYFDDCTVPSSAIIKKFLALCEQYDGVIAVHCLAGLGRTGTLISIWMMTHFGLTAAECIGWLRIVRPGSVIGPQQQFLCDCEKVDWKSADAVAPGEGPNAGLFAGLLSQQMANQVAQGMRARAASRE